MLFLTLIVGTLLGFSNGANDNFKGVATIYGSATASYRGALLWATVTTALGSVAAIFLAGKLLVAFTGNGLVPAEAAAAPRFALSVALAAGLTVLLATRLSFPISTTHALIGALVGAGLLASPEGVDTATLATGFALPLATSPFLAIALTVLIYPCLRLVRNHAGVGHETCICVGSEIVSVLPGRLDAARALERSRALGLSIDDEAACRVRYSGDFVGVNARKLLDAAHFVTAGLVGFARGLNDTPKIAALLLVGNLLGPRSAIVSVGTAIAIGGWLGARRVAETLAHRITEMNAGQGFTANLVTAGLVIGASNLGLPVSTTHVSCGALFGIGAVTRRAHWRTIRDVVLAWIVTLPVAGLLAAALITAAGALR